MVYAVALFLVGCGGSDAQIYGPDEVEQAFGNAGLPLQRMPSVGAEQPAMGETSSCATRYLVRSRGALITVSVCDAEADAADVAPDDSMHRANIAVETSIPNPEVHDRISRALDALEG